MCGHPAVFGSLFFGFCFCTSCLNCNSCVFPSVLKRHDSHLGCRDGSFFRSQPPGGVAEKLPADSKAGGCRLRDPILSVSPDPKLVGLGG